METQSEWAEGYAYGISQMGKSLVHTLDSVLLLVNLGEYEEIQNRLPEYSRIREHAQSNVDVAERLLPRVENVHS